MVAKLQVRRATEGDAAETLEFLDRISRETDFMSFTPGNVGITLEQQLAYLRSLDEPGSGTLLKAVVDGRIAGSASITRPRSVRFRHSGDVGIAVLKQYWRQGVGRALMEGVVREGRHLGLRRLSLRVRADNARAIALYESIGFRHEGRLLGAFAVGDDLYDDLQMGLLYEDGPLAP